MRVTIIIPTYNRAHLVHEAIDSVLDQTFTDFELLVVDDGSTDNTADVVQGYRDPRLRYLAQSNQGAAAALNAGLRAAQGEYLAFLDSDDLFHVDKLERQVRFLDGEPEAGLVFTGHRTMDAPGRIDPLVDPRGGRRVALEQLVKGPVLTFSSILVRMSYVKKAGFFNEDLRTGVDREWLLRLAITGCRMLGIPEALTIKRVHPHNLVRGAGSVGSNCLKVLEVVFSSPEFPPKLRHLRAVGRAHCFARISGLACVDDDLDTAVTYARKAMSEIRGAPDGDPGEIALQVVHTCRGISLGDPDKALLGLATRLSRLESPEHRFARLLRAALYATETCDSFQREDRWGTVRGASRYLFTVFPRVDNRGVVAMLGRALLGRF